MFSDKDIDTQSYMCMNHDAILIDSFFFLLYQGIWQSCQVELVSRNIYELF